MRTRLLACSALCALLLLTAAASASAWSILSPIFPPTPPQPGFTPWYPGADNYLWYPKGLAFDPGGGGVTPGVWMTDVGHATDAGMQPNAVFKFPLGASPAGGTQPLQVVGPVLRYANGTVADSLDYPGGVAVDSATHNIYIADSDNHTVIELNSAGQVLNEAPSGQVAAPHGMVIHDSKLYVADPGSHDIRVASLDLQTWSTTYTSSGFKSGPAMLTIDNAGHIWAPDEGYRVGENDGLDPSIHGRVVELNIDDGLTVRTITDSSYGQLYGAAFDAAAGVVYVGDYSKDAILVFDASTGALKESIPSGGSFVTPVGMDFDPVSRILYFGSVGSKNWHDGATKRTIQRIDFSLSTGPTGPTGPSGTTSSTGSTGGDSSTTGSSGAVQSNTAGKDPHTPTLGRPSFSIRRAHGKILVTGSLPVFDYAGDKLTSSQCSGRVTTALGRTVTTALKHPLVKRSTKLSAHGGCHIPVSLRLRTQPLPKTGHLRIAYAGGGVLEAFSASVPVKLR